ncbi:aldo/keto reductase, putative [Talaromyces stipitatus ATCC 10500]|uniref:Aldo/keto reductase, putative n=1 Tax=Talaromyces stipitatus (strain ATCC 10500 / CBS 375.48 / QM 6759 / NRRL 1006) TaxID=441959 RepID=B8MQM4_TALSN|nr:aldo/keto reductase, putative [Talaromyces stipitatus ATCC 10500]EED13447.1 aldo/keto reductase, putative [Talaromyces stipitatus ATCC 10500]
MSVTIANRIVNPIGFGLMGLTARQNSPSFDESIKVMKRALELGATFWNGGEFYGPPESNSLHLLEYYFRKYPEDVDKVTLSIKGCFSIHDGRGPDNSPEGVRKSVENCLSILQGRVPIHIFEPARIDPNTPIEETIKVLAEYVKQGKIGAIGLSEAGSKTIRRAHAIHPISSVELELSLFTPDILENGIAATCADLQIPIVAYSPLGAGFLSDRFRKLSDLSESEFRRYQPRFQPGAFEANVRIADEVRKIAQARAGDSAATTAQVAIAWVLAQGEKVGLPSGMVVIPGSTTVERVEENMKEVKLSEEELHALNKIVEENDVQGGRYMESLAKLING